MVVEVEFEIDKVSYKIVRGLKPTIFQIYKDDVLVPQYATSTEYQDYLQTYILRISENVFKQLIFLGANISGKSFIEMSKSEKEELFQIVSDTTIFQNLLERIKDKEKDVKTRETNALYKKNLLYENIMEREVEIQKLETHNSTQQKLFEEKNSNARIELQTQLEDLTQKSTLLQSIKTQVKEALCVQEETTSLQNKLVEEIKLLENDILKYNNLQQQYVHCIGCEKLKDIIPNIDIQDATEKLSTLKQQYKETQDKLKTIQENIDALKTQGTVLNTEVKNIPLIQQQLQELESINQPVLVEIDYSELENKKIQYQETLDELETIKVEYKHLNTLKQILSNSNLKDMIMNSHLSLLNKYVNMYIQNFENFNFVFSLDSSLKEHIKHRGEEFEFYSLSNGQNMRLSYAIMFALLKLIETKHGVSVNILILDEVLDSSLDYEGRIEILDIIKKDLQTKEVFIISHNDTIKNSMLFDKKYYIENSSAFSKISIVD
jgi:DNA repair exonuclease SbcCD ATPase subunit